MRRRVCKVCGKEFEASGEQHMCPDCRKAAQRETVVRERKCISCGAGFPGGPRAWYCPECRAERAKETQKDYRRRKASGKVRAIGSTDICRRCGKEYIVNGGLQMYCPACAEEAVREKTLPKKRIYAQDRSEERQNRKKELRENGSICVICGRLYTSGSPSVTCGPECAERYRRLKMSEADYKRGRRKSEPSPDRQISGLPQSGMAGVNYHRRLGKWQVTHAGRYIGLFETKEAAEAKKRELEEEPQA